VNERDLFDAYRFMAQPAIEVEDDWVEEAGAVKCLVESCLTMISISARRSICRFHTGKAQRGEIRFKLADDSTTALKAVPVVLEEPRPQGAKRPISA
jgi:hypothetical protein